MMAWQRPWDHLLIFLEWGKQMPTFIVSLDRWALGIERISALIDSALLPKKDRPVAIIPIYEGSETPEKARKYFCRLSFIRIGVSQSLRNTAFKLSQDLREAGVSVFYANNELWYAKQSYVF